MFLKTLFFVNYFISHRQYSLKGVNSLLFLIVKIDIGQSLVLSLSLSNFGQ